jgi:hypothetical protein
VSEGDRERDAIPEASHDRRPQLSELVGEWRWRPDPDDREPSSATDEDSSSAADHELIRVYMWAQILIG